MLCDQYVPRYPTVQPLGSTVPLSLTGVCLGFLFLFFFRFHTYWMLMVMAPTCPLATCRRSSSASVPETRVGPSCRAPRPGKLGCHRLSLPCNRTLRGWGPISTLSPACLGDGVRRENATVPRTFPVGLGSGSLLPCAPAASYMEPELPQSYLCSWGANGYFLWGLGSWDLLPHSLAE